MAYSDIERLTAMEIAQRAGGSITAEVMAEIRAAIGKPVSSRAVRFWLSEENNFIVKKDASPAIQAKVNDTLDHLFEQVAEAMLQRALQPDVIAATKGRDAVMAAAIAYDKMRLARGLPTDIIAVLPSVIEALHQLGLQPSDVFNAILAEAHAKTESDRDRGD
jgi:hypothetical protein